MKSRFPIIIAITLASVGLIVLCVSIYWIIQDKELFIWWNNIDSKKAAELGSFISGFVGVFWTAAGVVLIYATFTKQKELNEKQHFENSFYNLLNIYHDITTTTTGSVHILFKGKIDNCEGRAFHSNVLQYMKEVIYHKDFQEELKQKINIPEISKIDSEINNDYRKPNKETYNKAFTEKLFKLKDKDLSLELSLFQYEYVYNDYQDNLGHYFRFIYNIFKFVIEENKKNDKAIRRYLNLIQAQMSNDELGLLFYNVLSENGRTSSGEQRFYTWLNEYDFLENIDESSLLHRNHHKHFDTIFKFLTEEEKDNKKKNCRD